MREGRYSRRVLLGVAATTALAGCSGVTDQVPEELGGSDGGSTVDGGTERAIVMPILRLTTAYNSTLMSMADGFLTQESPVREQLTTAVLEAYEITEVGIRSVTRWDETSASVEATLSYRSVAESEASFTTRFENRQGADHWLVHDIDDPVPILSMEGIPTSTSEPTPASEPLDGFEGSLDPWVPVVDEFGQREDVFYSGTYSGGITTGGPDTGEFLGVLARANPPSLAGGRRPKRISYHWLEREENFGGGLRVLNSEGEVEVGVATDNPQWVVEDGLGRGTVSEGDGYDRWVSVTITFDWAAERVKVEFEDRESGQTASRETALAEGVDAETLRLEGFTSEEGWRTESCHMFWDDIIVESEA